MQWYHFMLQAWHSSHAWCEFFAGSAWLSLLLSFSHVWYVGFQVSFTGSYAWGNDWQCPPLFKCCLVNGEGMCRPAVAPSPGCDLLAARRCRQRVIDLSATWQGRSHFCTT